MATAGARTIDPFRLVRRHMILLIATGIFGVFLGLVAWFLLNRFSPLYSGEVLFQINAGLTESREVASQDLARDDLVLRLATTESMLLTSRGVLEAACKTQDVQSTVWFRKNFTDDALVALIDEAVDELEEDLNRKVVQGTNLFGLRWSAATASDVPIVLNSIGRAYLERGRQIGNEVYNDNIALFRSELTKTSRKLDDLGQRIEEFIREKGITSLDDPRSNSLMLALQHLVERMSETNANLNMGRSMREQVAAKLEGTIEPSDEDRRMAEEHPAVRPHELAVMQNKTILRELREKYRDPNNYMTRNSERRLRALELEYEAKIDEIMGNNLHASLKALTDSIDRSKSLVDELEGDYEEKDSLMQSLAADMSRYLEMEEERNHLALTRDADIELIKEVNLMRLRADSARVAMAQRALTPREKSFPKIEFIVPATAVLVLGLMTGLLFLREVTDQRVKTASDLFVVPDARVLGVIPELEEDPTRAKRAELAVLLSPRSVLAESYRQACALIDKSMARMGHQTLLVVGGLPEAGTTTIVTNIAASAAASGRSVIVVDANFRRSRLAGAMGVDGDAVGLGELLIEKAAIDDAIQTTESDIHVMSAGKPAHRVYERFNSGRFESVMSELRHRFDLIIIDAPPAVVAGDAMVLANKVDAAIMIVRAYQEQRGLVARLMNQLVDARCEMLGMILNRPRGTAGGYFKKNFDAMASYADEPQT
jgi:capsular exopolysaccharide synthesis family protein